MKRIEFAPAALILALALWACAPQAVPIETSLELPLVARGLVLEDSVASPYPRIEVLHDGSVVLNGTSFTDPGAEFRSALHALLETLPKIPEEDWNRTSGEAGMVDVPFVVLAAGDTPYVDVREMLSALQYKNIGVWDLLLAVREPLESRTSALHINLYMDFGTSCGPDAKLITELDWFPNAQEAGTPRGALRIARVESYHGLMSSDPPPIVNEHEPIQGDSLGQWLRETSKGIDGITFEAGADATWQDVLSLLELCLVEGVESAGDLILIPTLDVWFPERREPSVWDPAPDWED